MEIEQHHVGRGAPHLLDAVAAALRGDHAIRGRRECLSYLLRHEDCVIIDEQQMRHDRLREGYCTPGGALAIT